MQQCALSRIGSYIMLVPPNHLSCWYQLPCKQEILLCIEGLVQLPCAGYPTDEKKKKCKNKPKWLSNYCLALRLVSVQMKFVEMYQVLWWWVKVIFLSLGSSKSLKLIRVRVWSLQYQQFWSNNPGLAMVCKVLHGHSPPCLMANVWRYTVTVVSCAIPI